MLKLLSATAVAFAAILAATPSSPASAAQFAGHSNFAGGGGQFGQSHGSFVKGGSVATTPKQKRWVCGPIVNYDGSPHCHWVP